MSKNTNALTGVDRTAFLLYACSKGTVKQYERVLKKRGLTYTQYLVLSVLRDEKEPLTLKSIGHEITLDSGTLTPILKKLANKGLVTRARAAEDERNLMVTITDAGKAALEDAVSALSGCRETAIPFAEERKELDVLLFRMMSRFD